MLRNHVVLVIIDFFFGFIGPKMGNEKCLPTATKISSFALESHVLAKQNRHFHSEQHFSPVSMPFKQILNIEFIVKKGIFLNST